MLSIIFLIRRDIGRFLISPFLNASTEEKKKLSTTAISISAILNLGVGKVLLRLKGGIRY